MRCLVLAALVAAFLLSAPSVAAQQNCPPRDIVLSVLAETRDERPVGAGVSQGGPLIELLASRGGESWTLIATYPNGRSCLLATGQGWRTIEVQPNGEGA